MEHFLIDTDTASDDAVALMMALKHPDVTVDAITVVAGNVPARQGAQNALYTAELCGADVPVYLGAERPLLRPLETGQGVHGQDGMGDIGLPLSGRATARGQAVDAIVETIRRRPGEITLVTLGPLTNIALALHRDPGIAGLVKRYVMMGGIGLGYGNISPAAEFNIWVDPEAAKLVFESGLPIEMVGWDLSHTYAVFDPGQAADLRAEGTPLAQFAVDIQKELIVFATVKMGLAGFDLPDPLAMAVALDPSVAVQAERRYVAVEAASPLTRGQTVVDHLRVTGREPNTLVVRECSREKFLSLLYAAVRA